MRRGDVLRVLGGAAAAAGFARAAQAQELQTIRIGLAEGDDATPTLYAIKNGLFKKYGIDAQLTPVASGAAGLAALAGGSIDVTGTSLLPFLSARSKGLPLTIVAPLAAYSPDSVYAAILVKKESTYKTGRDLNGKTIASPALRDLNWVASMAWIDQNGGDSSTVKSIEVPASVIPAALEDGHHQGVDNAQGSDRQRQAANIAQNRHQPQVARGRATLTLRCEIGQQPAVLARGKTLFALVPDVPRDLHRLVAGLGKVGIHRDAVVDDDVDPALVEQLDGLGEALDGLDARTVIASDLRPVAGGRLAGDFALDVVERLDGVVVGPGDDDAFAD